MQYLKTMAGAAIGAIGFAGASGAAGIPSELPADTMVISAAPVSWSGPYAGANLGFGGFGTGVTDLADDMFDGEGAEMNLFGDDFFGGVQAGFNMSSGRLVYGVEVDIQGTGFDETGFMDGDDHRAAASWNWFATLRGRAGVSVDNSLLYVTGGLAYVDADYCGSDGDCTTDGDDQLAFTDGRLGYAVGAGVETKLSGNLSMKAEYLYIDVPEFQKPYDDDEVASFATQAHLFRLGLNYHFGQPSTSLAASSVSFQGGYVSAFGSFGGAGTGVIDLDGDMFDGSGKDEAEMNVFGNGLGFGIGGGYDFDRGDYVLGIVADIQGFSYGESSGIDEDHLASGAWNWIATVRGRAGRKFGKSLLYGTAGIAAINADFCGADGSCITDGDEDLAFDKTVTGYTAGFGVETQLSSKISLQGEYLYLDGDDFTEAYDDDQFANFRTSGHLFRAGLNYRF
ncbi:outer membrane protein [Jannaschia ovalis]|uniref:Outer membrane beta-barrel protein n=1 Tax=Jannaschia ovalis TaxID=3038773 RepID=A0ABY8LC02_9RHOB|nr:outer membrane beta-barrel protein [Jannaschia sp. GRR-S6-38]WGH77928.1 outer membrane beta-barrel protein [Jannaschia sp. GRR-S6-38]